jgi:hypothetical protein
MLGKTCLLFCLFASFPALGNSPHNLGGPPNEVQFEVGNLQKDAELIGMSKEKLRQAGEAKLTSLKIKPSKDGKKPALVLKVTTIDVGPRLSSYVLLEFKELARLLRKPGITPSFVTSWSKAKMVASEPTKHEAQVIRATEELIQDFLRASLE